MDPVEIRQGLNLSRDSRDELAYGRLSRVAVEDGRASSRLSGDTDRAEGKPEMTFGRQSAARRVQDVEYLRGLDVADDLPEEDGVGVEYPPRRPQDTDEAIATTEEF